MKTRSRKSNSQENQPPLCDGQKSTKSKVIIKSPPPPGDNNVKHRFALKERTNLSGLEECVNSSPKGKHSEKASPGRESVTHEKVLRRSSRTPKGQNLNSTTFSNRSGPQPDSRFSSLKRCVYMNTIPEDEAMDNNNGVYEFVVDKNEPPSRRRRRKRTNTKVANKPKGYPKKRLHSNSEESSTASLSTATSSFASSHNTFLGKNLSFKEPVMKKDELPADTSVVSSNLEEDVIYSPVHSILTPATPSTVLASCTKRVALTSVDNDPSSTALFTTNHPTVECSVTQPKRTNSISGASGISKTIVMNPPVTPTKSSFCNSSVWSEGPSFCLAMTKHHSTPCKSRSCSDTSACEQLGEQHENKENCFGFSSDEDEENVSDLPSPVHPSPLSHIHRQGLLLSPNNAPSRFAPEVVKRALALKAVSKPLDFGCSKNVQSQRKLNVAEKKKGEGVEMVGGRCKKRTKVRKGVHVVLRPKPLNGESHGITGKVNLQELSTPTTKHDVEGGTPVAEGLFEDLEANDDKLLKVAHPRRSYGRPGRQKSKKVVGGGLCLESGDEEDLVMELGYGNVKESEKAIEERCSPKLHRKRNKKNMEKKEKEMDHWASLMNMKFEEVEDFDLCVDKV